MFVSEVIGNLGQDAEIKTIAEKNYVSFSVAHTIFSKENNGSETTLWISCLWYGDGGNRLQFLKKGTKVYLRGDTSIKEYQDKEGKVHTSVNIFVRELELCGIKQAQP